MIGRTLQADRLVRLIVHTLDQRFQQPGLSYSRFAAHKNRLALAALDEFPPVEQDADFAVASNELRERLTARRVKRLSTSRSLATRNRGTRWGKPLSSRAAKGVEFERVAGEAAGIVCDHDLARLGDALEARSEVGSFARHLTSVEHAASGKIADDYAAARDADARLKRRASRRL